ncbi:MAG: argS [Haloplasmataceae bacterium]|jgi:arginyl-tRNA synthetase|nr:argS [Haloplasmataceae bacterium]
MNKVISLQQDIKDHLKEIVFNLGYNAENLNILLEEPKEKVNGDYSTNLAMLLTKIAKKQPKLIANEIVDRFNKDKYYVSKIDIAGPGFINFYMDNNYLTTVISEIINANENYGKNNQDNPIKINVEFVSANPTGDLHLGHARGAAIGDSLCRILTVAGFVVTREYYVNDAGNQIHNLALSTIARYEQQLGIDTPVPENGYHGTDIIDIAKSLFEKYGDMYKEDSKERYDLFRKYAKEYELEKIKKDLSNFRVEFDIWSSEQKLYDDNRVIKAIEKLAEKGYIYEFEGATWFKSTAFGDDKDRVLRKSDKSLTYLTPDIAYHIDKLERGYDKLINILGADHHGYIPRLKASIECLTGENDKLEALIIQMVRLIKNGEEYKMSKRSGKALTIRDLIEEVGIDAVRYFFAMRSPDSQMDFDIDLATSQSNDNPVYYAQYAHARISSIFRQAEEKNLNYKVSEQYLEVNSDKAYDLLKKLSEFPKFIVEAANKRAPHRITHYIYELASVFHSFYNAEKVINEENIEKTSQLLALVKATQITLKNALELIGVSAPDKM